MNTQHIQGIKLACLTALISGTANFLNKKIIISGIDPITLSIVKNGLVGLAFVGFFWLLFKQLKSYPFKNWLKLILIAIVGGSIPFVLFFKGLALSPAVVGSFIHKSLFIWVAIMAAVFLKERLNKYQLAGLAILFIGLLPIIKFNLFNIGRGEIMMLIATIFWSVEVILIKKFIQDIDYRILATFRMALGAIFISLFALITGGFSGIFQLSLVSWLKIFIVSLFLFGYVFTWYRALNLAPASLVTSVLTLALPVTILISSIADAQLPNINNLITIIFITIGVYFFIESLLNKPWTQSAPS